MSCCGPPPSTSLAPIDWTKWRAAPKLETSTRLLICCIVIFVTFPSFAVIMYEVLTREQPYYDVDMSAKEIVDLVGHRVPTPPSTQRGKVYCFVAIESHILTPRTVGLEA